MKMEVLKDQGAELPVEMGEENGSTGMETNRGWGLRNL